jgi:hypothetical protein
MGLRELTREAHVSKETLHGLEIKGREAWPRTRDKLACALDVHPWELMFPLEHVEAMLESDRHENALIKRQIATMTEEEISALMDTPAGKRIGAAIEHDTKERALLEAETQQDAG